jgi:small conductance mechanosensitive channel
MAATNNNNIAAESSSTAQDSLILWLFSWQDMFLFLIKLVIAIVIVWLLIVISKRISKLITRHLKAESVVDDSYTDKVSWLIGEIVFYTMLTLALIIGFMIMDIDLGRILWWISFGIGFAFKEILGNLIAGILVLTNKEFKLGEIISIDDDKYDYFGRIEEITIRYTVIRTFDLRKVVIPNLTLITRPVRTYDSEEAVRLDTVLTVHYQTDLHKALEFIKDAVNSVSYIKEKESTRVSILKFWDNGVDILVYFYFDPKAGMLIQTAKSGVHQAIYDMFLDKGIIIPYPHQVLTVDHNDKNLLGSLLYVGKELGKEK